MGREHTQTAGTQISPDRILELGLAFWGSKTLLSAVGLGVFTELAKGPMPYETLRKHFELHERSARDFLDALVALGMLDREGEVYKNTPEADRFLDRAKPCYIGGMLEMANTRLYPFWNSLTEGLRTGQPQNEVTRGKKLVHGALRDPGAPAAVPAGHDGFKPGCGQGHGKEVSLAEL